MTIAVGVLATDGVVVAADTELTYGVWKNHQGKISAMCKAIEGDPHGLATILITGAGDDACLQAMSAQLIEAFGQLDDVSDEGITTLVERAVLQFHHDHIIPWNTLPQSRPEIAMLVAAGSPTTKMLLTSSKTVVHDGGAFCSVGLGAHLADSLLSRYTKLPLLGRWQAALLAGMTILQVKESIPDCGKETDIYYFDDQNALHRIPRNITSQIDVVMKRYLDDLEPAIFRDVIGAPHRIGVTVDTMRDDVSGLLRRIRDGV